MTRIFYILIIAAFAFSANWALGQAQVNEDTSVKTYVEPSTTTNKDELSLVISPNPATNNFSISNDKQVGKVEVYNIIGSKVKSFDTRETSIFDVVDLPSGIYLVRAYDKANSSILSTLRLKKR